MSQRRPDEASPSLSHLPNNNNNNPHISTSANTTRPTTSGTSGNTRQRQGSLRKERILNNPPSSSKTSSSSHSRTASRSGNLIHNNNPPPHRDRGHSRTKSASISTTSSRSQRPTPASGVVIVQPSSAAARSHRRHTSISPPSQQQKPLSTSVVLQQRPATSYTESPDLSKSRQPARFSSNGIATSAGPPPSLAYRRNIAMDNRFSPRDTRGMTRDRDSASSSTISHFSRTDKKEGERTRERGSSFSTKRSSLRTEHRTNGYDNGVYEQREGTIRGLEDLQNGGVSIENGELDGGELGGEDVFLNLARSNSVSSHTENSAYRAERRRSRLTQLAPHRNSLPADTFSASPLRATQTHSPGTRTLTNSPAPTLHDGNWQQNRVSTPPTHFRDRRMSNASMADNADEQNQKSLTPRASFSRPLSMLRRERSPASTHTRSYSMAEPVARTRSSLANSVAPRQLHSSPRDGGNYPIGAMIDRDNNAAENNDNTADPVTPTRPEPSTSGDTSNGAAEDSSSVSTTAPSTVWDELDDLKSRIRRLELTGRIPASGVGSIGGSLGTAGTNASNSSGERPRTATTTVTTISSSPRNNNNNSSATGVSPANSTIGGPSLNTHPLLHAALAKSKPLISPEVFKYLEAASHDAVSLASAVGSTGSPGGPPPASGSMASDRQVRRKADSVCRSLTELCIALSENRGPLVAPNFALHLSQHYGNGRPVSRDVNGGMVRESMLGRDRSESILARELGLGRERERESILGRDRIESVMGNREGLLGRDGFNRESSFGRESGFGRESVIGDRSMLTREGSFGKDRTESMFGGRESLLNREGSFGRDRTESVLGNREGMLTRESSFGRESVVGDRLTTRLTSRFAERKGSIASISTTAGFLQSSPRQIMEKMPSPTTPSQSVHTGHLRSRNSMLLKSRPIFDDDEDPENYRSPSRAATEVMTHRPLRDYSAGTHIMTPSSSGALPPRRQYVIAHSTPAANGLPSPVLHQRRFFSNSSERSGRDGDTSGTTSLNSSFEGTPVNERLMSAAQADPDYSSSRYRMGSVGRTGSRRLARGLRESVDLDSGQQGGSLGRTPIVVGERDRMMRR